MVVLGMPISAAVFSIDMQTYPLIFLLWDENHRKYADKLEDGTEKQAVMKQCVKKGRSCAVNEGLNFRHFGRLYSLNCGKLHDKNCIFKNCVP